MRRLRKSRSAKVVSWFVLCALVFTTLPVEGVGNGRRAVSQGRSRTLTLAEMRVIKGGQIQPSDSTSSGAPESWEGSDSASPFSAVNVNTGNVFTSIPITGFAGRGLDVGLTLHHNSADTGSGANGPLSRGWTHSYNVSVSVDPFTQNVTVREGTGRKHTFLHNADGSYTHSAGNFETLVKNADNTYTLTRQHQVKLHFDAQNRLSTMVDPNNNTITLSYNGQGKLSSVTEPSGKALTLAYNGEGKLSSVTDPLNRTTTFTYDDFTGYLYTVTSPNNTTLMFTYDIPGRIWSITDPRGNVWESDYDSNGRIVESHHPGTGQTALRAYTWLSNGVDVADQTNKVVGYRKNASGELSQVIVDPYGMALTTSYGYDAQHNSTSVTNPRGYTSTTTYDSNGNALSVTDPLNRTVTMTYDSRNNPLTVTDNANHVTQYTYNASDDLTQVTDAVGNGMSYTYDAYGNRLSATDAAGHTSTFAYDASGNLTSASNPLGNTSQFTYNALGWKLTETDPLNRTTSYTYDVMGRVTQVTHPDNTVRQFAYDAAGNLTSVTDENNATATMAYNARGLQTSVTNPLNQTTSFSYDDAGRMTSTTNARGKTTTYTYDAAGRRTGVTYPDNTTRAVSYNANSRVASTTDGRGNVVNYLYNAADQLTTVDYPTGVDVTYTYNSDGLRVSLTDGTGTTNWSHDALHRLSSESTARGTVQYTYTTDGNRATMTLVGTGTTTYSWNAAHRLTALTNPYNETTSFTHFADGRLHQVTNPNSTTASYTYTTRGFVYEINHRKSDNTLLNGYRYTYDASGNRLRQTELVGTRYSDYFYDTAAQLTRFTERQIVGAQDPRGQYSDDTAIQDDSYAYDPVGNRLSLTDNLTSSQTAYTYDDFNKLLAAGNVNYTYDADGNCTSVALQGGGTTRTYSWGYNNKLKQITYGGGGTNTFTYDGTGRRVTKTDSTGSYSFVYDGERIISDGQAVYTRAGDSRLISERRGNSSQWHHSDGLTSTRTLTSSSQTTTDTFRYDVWGDIAERTGNTPTPHQFVGALGYEREADSGLTFIGTRYYDPSLGRFLSQDVAQWGVNWYVYAANNPASAIDTNGNNPLLIAGGIGVIAGGIIGGVGAYLNGGNVWQGIGKGIVIGGIAGVTGGWVGGVVGGGVGGGIGGGIAGGAASGVAGDIAGQVAGNVLGWQDGWNWQQTVGSGAIGAVTGGIGGYIGSIGKLKTLELHPSIPVGRRGNHLNVPPGTNDPTTIYGRPYSGHALDRMQERGLYPSVVENTIQTGTPAPGTTIGTTLYYYDPVNNVTVVIDSASGRVITTW
jgi:RHS repeat-associated protein